jgi:hypothetical protein
MKKVRNCLALAFVAVLAGCGGGNKSSTTTPPTPTPSPAPTTTSPVNAATTVVLGGGGSATGADILVPVAATPVTNAQVLGVTTSPTGGSAFNVGDVAHLGTTPFVLLFGPGLSSNMQVSISGPPDITIVPGSLISIQATNKMPGVQFQIVVSTSADLGARTVVLQSPNNDVTTFTGGLEVVP